MNKLKTLRLPTPIFVRVWQSGILPLLTYGCEIRDMSKVCDKLTTKVVTAFSATYPISLIKIPID